MMKKSLKKLLNIIVSTGCRLIQMIQGLDMTLVLFTLLITLISLRFLVKLTHLYT